MLIKIPHIRKFSASISVMKTILLSASISTLITISAFYYLTSIAFVPQILPSNVSTTDTVQSMTSVINLANIYYQCNNVINITLPNSHDGYKSIYSMKISYNNNTLTQSYTNLIQLIYGSGIYINFWTGPNYIIPYSSQLSAILVGIFGSAFIILYVNIYNYSIYDVTLHDNVRKYYYY